MINNTFTYSPSGENIGLRSIILRPAFLVNTYLLEVILEVLTTIFTDI